jgi:hypothetical protein
MTTEINRRIFISGALRSVAAVATLFVALPASSQPNSFSLCRISHGSYGGTSAYRLASIARRLADVPKEGLVRDWSMRNNAFIIKTYRPIEDVVTAALTDKEKVRVEVPAGELVTAFHQHKLPLHNYFRTRSGCGRLNVNEFAEMYPSPPDRKWVCLCG